MLINSFFHMAMSWIVCVFCLHLFNNFIIVSRVTIMTTEQTKVNDPVPNSVSSSSGLMPEP